MTSFNPAQCPGGNKKPRTGAPSGGPRQGTYLIPWRPFSLFLVVSPQPCALPNGERETGVFIAAKRHYAVHSMGCFACLAVLPAQAFLFPQVPVPGPSSQSQCAHTNSPCRAPASQLWEPIWLLNLHSLQNIPVSPPHPFPHHVRVHVPLAPRPVAPLSGSRAGNRLLDAASRFNSLLPPGRI